MNAIIIDDDPDFCDCFWQLLVSYARKESLNLHLDVAQSVKRLVRTKVRYDVYFIDIEMPELSGLELAKKLRKMYVLAEFIFVSAYESYMYDAFFEKPGAFIRKDNLTEDTADCVRYLKKIERRRKKTALLQDCNRQVEVNPFEILYCQNVEHYVWLYFLEEKRKMIRTKLNAVEEELTPYGFVRIHNRYLVNLNEVKNIDGLQMELKNGECLTISRRYKEQVDIVMMNWIAGKNN